MLSVYGICPNAFEKVLAFIYASAYSVKNIYEASRIIQAANYFQLLRLCEHMFKYLQIKIKRDNIWVIWEVSILYKCEETKKMCESFIRKESQKLLESDEWLSLDPDAVLRFLNIDHIYPFVPESRFYEAVLAWRDKSLMIDPNELDKRGFQKLIPKPLKYFQKSKHADKSIENYFEDMLGLIRFSQMENEYLIEHVETNDAVMNIERFRNSVSGSYQHNDLANASINL
ncbi:hypothetical protein CLU79DRAFT_839897 [Phycomyces nitens]|nr:hypothetical protein CLU79DRAFT_839897 [Phycomyces nitens]